MMAIVDYGLGNIMAFTNVYRRLDISVTVAKHPRDLEGASKVILPGVGAFDHAVLLLKQSGLEESLHEIVMSRRIPVLGVCVGMQILAASSEEGRLRGLGWVEGEVKKFRPTTTAGMRVPHMGWNDVRPTRSARLFQGIEKDARFYFLHSYYFKCASAENVLAETDYGGTFSSAISAANIYGVQFHPEKSHRFGTRLLQNFAEL
jgi:glutamine amidotransferase